MNKSYLSTCIIAIILLSFRGTQTLGMILLFLMAIPFIIFSIAYQNSCYRTVSQNPIIKVFFNKGLYGEFKIVRAIEGMSENERFIVNVYLEKGCGTNETTEVDIVYINEFGIFVIESKNYSGWIFGKENDLNWTQVLNKYRKSKFYNPIKQNAGHIAAIDNLIGKDYKHLCRNMVIFSDRCTLKKVTVCSANVDVIQRWNSRDTITRLSTSKKLDKQQINYIANKLIVFSNVDEITKQSHIETLENKRYEVKQKKVTPINNEQRRMSKEVLYCPKCGAHMVRRTATKGEYSGREFWGCSNYPNCKGIVNID